MPPAFDLTVLLLPFPRMRAKSLSLRLWSNVVAATLLLSAPALSAQNATVRFVSPLSGSSIVLAPRERAQAVLLIQNSGTRPVTARAERFIFRGKPGLEVGLPPAPVPIPPGAVAALVLTFRDTSAGGVQGTGQLRVAVEADSATVLTRTVRIARGGPPVSKWTTAHTMYCPFVCKRASLPFDEVGAAQGRLLRKNGTSFDGLAQVRGTAEKGIASRRLIVSGLDGAGIYAGDLPVANGSVELTVHARHWMVWLLFAIMIGVLFGVWQSHYSSVRRSLWEFRAECGELQEKLAKLPATGGLTPDTTEAGKRVARALADVEALRSAAFRDIEHQPAYTASLNELREVQAMLTAWSGLAAKLVRVREALSQAEHALRNAPRPPAPESHALTDPEVMQWARASVAERTLSLEDAPTFSTDLDKAPGALELIVTLNTTAVAAQRWIQELEPRITDSGEKVTLEATRKKLNQAWWEVWTSDDPAQLTNNQTQKDLADIEEALAQFNHHLPKHGTTLEAAFADEQVVLKHTASRLERSRATHPPAGAVAAQRDWRWYRQLVLSWDWAFMILATVLAILTGLKLLYYDGKFFGTPADYLTAILWGFGVKTAVDLTLATAGRFFGVRSVRAALAAPAPVLGGLTPPLVPGGTPLIPPRVS